MGLTTAMYTGLSGLNVNQARIDTIGNNIANVNTTAFKGSRTLFQTQFSHLISAGNGPTETSGGVNPTQIGLGAVVGATQRNFTPGSIETTGIASDLAIQGNGLFIVRKPDGQQAYTRDGSFSLDSQNRLVTIDGNAVRGFAVDESFNVVSGVLSDLVLPLGTLTLSRPTQNVVMDGDLSAAGTIATQGSIHTSQIMVDGGGAPASAATALTDLRSSTDAATPLFLDGTTITVSGVEKGDRTLPSRTFVVGADGSTFGDFAAWLQGLTGISAATDIAGAGSVTIENGALVIRSDPGEQNAFTISNSDITTDNAGAAVPLAFTQSREANGSSVTTSYTVYDSLGNPAIVSLTFVLEQMADTGPVWRFYAESADNAGGASRYLGTGTISFDTNGNYISASGTQLNLGRAGTGAVDPLTFNIDFSQINGLSTAASNVIMAEQDGFPPGTLSDYSVGTDGVITGTFSNGLTRSLGQVAIASFPNPEGLVAQADNLYVQGPNSGTPTVTTPGLFGAGTVLSGALELSNVDLSREFIGLITSSSGFQAASRVISTSSDMLEQLLLVVR